MALEATSTVIKQCLCGATVAWLMSSRGNVYSVEIRNGVVIDTSGNEAANVIRNDFHECGAYRGLAKFMRNAIDRSGAKRLRVKLLTAANLPVLLSWSEGNTALHVSDGMPYHLSTYYASVNIETGGFRFGERATVEVKNLLEAVDKRPLEAARAYGRATNECCFCQQPLDDERSILAGYGSHCAKKFALPWGTGGENTTKRAKRTRKAVRIDSDSS
jgi:uncharacterized protein DUF6011